MKVNNNNSRPWKLEGTFGSYEEASEAKAMFLENNSNTENPNPLLQPIITAVLFFNNIYLTKSSLEKISFANEGLNIVWPSFVMKFLINSLSSPAKHKSLWSLKYLMLKP